MAAMLIVVIFASAINIDRVRRSRKGRDAFVKEQSERYDRYFANPNLNESVIESLLRCGAFIVVYELIAYNSLKIMTILSRKDSAAEGKAE